MIDTDLVRRYTLDKQNLHRLRAIRMTRILEQKNTKCLREIEYELEFRCRKCEVILNLGEKIVSKPGHGSASGGNYKVILYHEKCARLLKII
jgi:tRNA(Ile2) C34 agmatinyltransferase TiaS